MTTGPCPPQAIRPRLELALSAACEAGEITLEYFRRDDLEVERRATIRR